MSHLADWWRDIGLDLPRRLQPESHALIPLQKTDNHEKIIRPRVARGPQHPHQALGRDSRCLREFRKTNSRVDVIAQDGLRCGDITGKQGFNAFAEKFLAKLRITCDTGADGLLKITCQRRTCPLSFSVYSPAS